MKKKWILLSVALLLLTACANSDNEKSEKGDQSLNSASSSNVESTNEEEMFDEYEDDDNFGDSDEEMTNTGFNQLTVDPDTVVSNQGDSYEVPEKLHEKVGSYKGTGIDYSNDGHTIEIKINKDGSYQKLDTEYHYEMTDNQTSTVWGGYFDSSNKFNKKEYTTEVNGKKYRSIKEMTYSEGVVVEKFGDLYLVNLMTVSNSSFNYFMKEDGQLDYTLSVVTEKLHNLSTSMNGHHIPTMEELIEVIEKPALEYSLSDNLEEVDKINDDVIESHKITLSSSEELSDLVKNGLASSLEDYNEKEDFLNTLNATYQIYTGSSIYDKNVEFSVITDFSNVYNNSGEKAVVDYAYKGSGDQEVAGTPSGDITFVSNQKIYGNVQETDGKYILKDSSS